MRSQECPKTGQYEEATISRIRHLRVAAPPAPIAVNRTVPPKRVSNASLRSREHLTPDEVEQLITAARQRGRYGHHACGFKLADEGHDTRAIQQYLGHRNIAHTVRYTELAPGRFKAFWKD